MTHIEPDPASPSAAQSAPDLPSKVAPSGFRAAAEIVQSVLCALLIAGLMRIFVFQPFTIPSSSMEPGLVTGDYILVSKFAYGWSRASFPFNPPLPGGRFGLGTPSRGDVVVFRRPSDPAHAWIKRIIGLPGDEVQVVAGDVRVNGQGLRQTALRETLDRDAPLRSVLEVRERGADGRTHTLYGGDPGAPVENTGVYRVPRGAYFVMGDNRDNSLDSRFPADVGVGFLPAENLIGKAEMVLFSWRPHYEAEKPWTWFGFQADRFVRLIR